MNKYKSKDGASLILARTELEAMDLCGGDVILIEEDCGVKLEWDVEKPSNFLEKIRIKKWAKRMDRIAKLYDRDSCVPDWCFKL